MFSVGATQLSVADPAVGGGATGVEDCEGVGGVEVVAVESVLFETPAQAATQETAMNNVAHRAAAAACLTILTMPNYRSVEPHRKLSANGDSQ